jgi:hypothetical protein
MLKDTYKLIVRETMPYYLGTVYCECYLHSRKLGANSTFTVKHKMFFTRNERNEIVHFFDWLIEFEDELNEMGYTFFDEDKILHSLRNKISLSEEETKKLENLIDSEIISTERLFDDFARWSGYGFEYQEHYQNLLTFRENLRLMSDIF